MHGLLDIKKSLPNETSMNMNKPSFKTKAQACFARYRRHGKMEAHNKLVTKHVKLKKSFLSLLNVLFNYNQFNILVFLGT